MGGKALAGICPTRRYSAEEYDRVAPAICQEIALMFGVEARIVPSYKRKPDHGDLDLLIVGSKLPTDYQQQLVSRFESKGTYDNGPVFSFEVNELQVDIIKVAEEDMEIAYCYHAYNDLGNLLGRLAHSLGMRLGSKGLYYEWIEGTNLLARRTLTKDWNKILEVLGCDPKAWRQGFEYLEEIFAFVAASPYFSRNIYLLENRDHKSRVRDSKRKTYMAALDWFATACNDDGQPKLTDAQRRTFIIDAFPHFEGWDAEVWAAENNRKVFKTKFNGDICSKATGLSGRELGVFMNFFNDRNPGLKDRIFWMHPDDIQRLIQFEFAEFEGVAL